MHRTTIKTIALALLLTMTAATAAHAEKKDQDTLVILGGTGNPPFEYINKKGEPEGFNVELFRSMMSIIKRPYKIVLKPWKESYQDITSGKADIVMGMVYSPKRAETIKFGRPTAYINLKWVVRKDSRYYSEDDLKYKRIGCRNSGFSNVQLRAEGNKYTIVPTESNVKAFELLFKGKCDAVLCDEIIAKYIGSQNEAYKGNIRILTSHFINSEYRIAGNWHSNKILEELSAALQQLQEEHVYDDIYNDWFNPEIEKKQRMDYVMLIGIAAGVLVLIGLIIIYWFRHKLHTSTRHIRTLNTRLNNQLKTLQKQNDELKHAQIKADAGAKAMETLFSTVTHELRTPMNSIQGFTQLLSDPDLADEERQYMEQQIKKSTKELTDLINSMIQLAEFEAGTINVRREFFCVNEMFENVTNLYRSINDNPELTFECDLPHEKVWVELDKKLTTQCMEHFMSNGMKFTKKGHVRVTFKTREDGVQFIIEDTGIGMTREQIRNIFKRFMQNDAYTPGLGLGLHLATAIIHSSNGKLETVSEPGKGTTFKAFIPCKVMTERAPEVL